MSPSDATGKVTFYDGATILGYANVFGGTAQLTVRLPSTGKQSILARYGGNMRYNLSVSNPLVATNSPLPGFGWKETRIAGATASASMLVADFNGDGIPDLVSASLNTVSVYLGKGDGSFGAGIATDTGTFRLSGLAAADMNADGKMDLVANYAGGVTVMLGRGDGYFNTSTTLAGGSATLIADFNNDGFPDVAGIVNSYESLVATFDVYLNRGDGTLTPSRHYTFPGPTSQGSDIVSLTTCVGDLNNDGNVDVVAVSATGVNAVDNQVDIFLGDGTGAFTMSDKSFLDPAHYLPGGPAAIALGDIDGDGNLDLVIGGGAVELASGSLRVFFGNGDGTFQGVQTLPLLDPNVIGAGSSRGPALLIEDVNGDGLRDIVAGLASDYSGGFLEVFPAKRDGTFDSVALYATSLVPDLQIGDFNGDGLVDFAAAGGILTGAQGPYFRLSVEGPASVTKGQRGAVFSVVATNVDRSVASQGTVTLSIPSSTSSGVGWSCSGSQCTRSDSLPAGATFPPIYALVDLSSAYAGTTLQVGAIVSGGSSPASQASVTVPVGAPSKSCQYSIRASPSLFTAAGGSGSISINAPASCLWSVDTSATPWISTTVPSYGSDNGSIAYAVAPNPNTLSRTATIAIGTQTVTVTQSAGPPASTPAVAWVGNAFSDVSAIAPNTWVQVRGSHLAPQSVARIWTDSDFSNGKMPTQLSGVSVTVNGKAAYVYYISDAQLNILTPPDALPVSATIQVTVNGAVSNALAVPGLSLSTSFFELVSGQGVHYVYGRHGSDNSLVGPRTLYPGYTSPIHPGEVFYVAATGFGPTDVPVVSGSVIQSGTVPPPLPSITIGGIVAATSAPVLVAPGTYQINITVPTNAPTGDLPLVATFGGGQTQTNLLLSVGP